MSKPVKRLGRGLSSLISAEIGQVSPSSLGDGSLHGAEQIVKEPPSPQPELAVMQSVKSGNHRLQAISLDLIRQNPHQPRKRFDDTALAGLARSLKERGALQPIVVRPAEGGYELVAGERRFRASKLAGLTEIPAIIRPVADDQMLELALIENIQRAELNPVERARAYRQFQQGHHLSHEEIAARVGEDRATVTNYMRILGLPEQVLGSIEAGEISLGHAKAILSSADPNVQLSLAERIIKEGWSVRRTEAEVGRLQPGDQKNSRGGRSKEKRAAVRDMEERLSGALGLRVIIQEGARRHTGKVVVEYYNLNDFERLAKALGADGEGL